MTPDQLDHLLALADQPPFPPESDADEALDRLEAACEAGRGAAAERAFGALMRRVEATRGLPPVVAGVRREALVRWDAWSVTFTGHDTHDGRPVMVRVLHGRPDPRRLRWLARQGRGLPGVQTLPEALVADLPGQPLAELAAADPELGRRLVSGLVALRGRGVPPLTADELRVVDGATRVVCLTRGPDASGGIAALASTLLPAAEGPLADVLRGLAEMPPRTVDDAEDPVVRALARELAGVRHHLLARWSATLQHTRVERLMQLLDRLDASLTPPRGRAAAGVDFDGRVQIVTCDEDTVAFGPVDALEPVWSNDDGFDAVRARRLLRAQAAAPPNPRLSREVGGNDAFGDAIGRWVAAGLRLRTLRLLLARQA